VSIPKNARLTNELVRSLPFAGSERPQYIVSDTAQKGFRVRVGRKTKTYLVQLDISVLGKRKTVKHTIGDMQEWSATAARTEAQRLMLETRENASRHVNRREALKLRHAWADYRARLEARIATGAKSARSLEARIDHMERLLSDWLDVPLRQLGDSPHLVAERHRQITAKSGPIVANRAMESFRAIYNDAAKRRLDPGIPPVSPTSAVDWNNEERRSTGMSPDELQAWAGQLSKLQNHVRCEFHLFCLLSAMRPDALKRARWEHIDPKRRVLHVPKPKGGARRAFDLPLSRDMIRCPCRARRAGRIYGKRGDEWIFPSDTQAGHIAHHKERRHVLSHWGGDLRQTYRGMAVLAGVDELSIRILMNHALGDVSTGYLTVAALRDHLREQQERVSAKIIEAMALPDLAGMFRRDIKAKLDSKRETLDPKTAKMLEARRQFFGYDRL